MRCAMYNICIVRVCGICYIADVAMCCYYYLSWWIAEGVVMKISGATFIKNNFKGAFCLLESLASWLCVCDEVIILDLGSTDGTLGVLNEVASKNKRVHIAPSRFKVQDASAFATAANDVISLCSPGRVIFWQADEIPHEHLLFEHIRPALREERDDLSFWRYQLKWNFQQLKWSPHLVHRVGNRGNFTLVDDGMNSKNVWDTALVGGEYDGGWFTKWGELYGERGGQQPAHELPTDHMIFDVSMSGGFRDNIPFRSMAHAPFWHQSPVVEGDALEKWQETTATLPEWTLQTTKFDIPAIMRWHLGRTVYTVRGELLDVLCNDVCEEYIRSLM